MGLGFSTQAQADSLFVNWLPSRVDCPSACGKTGLKFAIPTGIDHKTGKPSFFICATRRERGGEWHSGFNTWGKNTCTTAFGNEVYNGEKYSCLCTNNPRMRPFK